MGPSINIIIVLSIFVLTAVMFISNVVRTDIVAVMVLAALGITKIMPPEYLFSGFSSEAVISLIAVMIIGSGLENSGISLKLARLILKLGKENPHRIFVLVTFASGLLASIMRSLGSATLFIPVIRRISIRAGINKSFLLLPMAFAAILGGTLTMVGSGPLIILNSVLKHSYDYVFVEGGVEHIKPFNLLDVFPIGCVVCLVGLAYLFYMRNKITPQIKELFSLTDTRNHFKKIYGKGGDVYELRVSSKSKLAGLPLKDIGNLLDSSCSIVAVMQGQELYMPPLRGLVLKANAVIAILGERDEVTKFADIYGCKILPKLNTFSEHLHPARAGLSEVVIPPSSKLIGNEVRDLHMKRNHRLHVLALYRANGVLSGDELNNVTLKSGDTLGVFSTWESLHEFEQNPDFVVITTAYPREKIYPQKNNMALFFFVLSFVLALLFNYPISVSLLLGAVGMIATGVINIDQAYNAVSWSSVFILAGLFPLGIAMQTSGTTEWLISLILPSPAYLSPWVFQCGLAVLSTILALFVSNVGATIMLVPLAIELAFQLGVEPKIFALTVALSATNTFLLPTQQVNTLIAGHGGYTVKDFIRIGFGMTLLYWATVILGVRLFF